MNFPIRRSQLRRSALALAALALLGPSLPQPAAAVPLLAAPRPFAASVIRVGPTPYDLVIGDGGIDSDSNNGGIVTVIGNLVLGNQASGNGTYTSSGNTAQTNIVFQSGGNGGNANGALLIGNAGVGSFVQGLGDGSDSGNQVNVAGDLVLGVQVGSVGFYTLNTGALSVGGQLAVGGQSQGSNLFTQNGGSLVLTGLANGPYGTNPDYVPVGGPGAFGGALAIGGGIGGNNAGGNGTYVLNAGTITTYNLLVGGTGTGTMQQNGGDVTTTFVQAGFTGTGTYNLAGGTLNAYSGTIGYAGTGTFNQSGGTHTLQTTLRVGVQFADNSPGSGAYNLTGGTLTSGNTFIGQGETGTFVVNDNDASVTHNVTGNVVVGTSSVAWDGSSPTLFGTGSYTITGGAMLNVLTVVGGNGAADPPGSNGSGNNNVANPAPNGAVIVGEFGTGTFVQGVLGGTDSPGVNLAGDLVLGNQRGSQGQYTLNTGLLTVAGKIVVGGASTNAGNLFTQNAGLVSITGTASNNADYVGVGSNDWIGWLNIGGNGLLDQGAGTYQMNGGLLSATQGIGVGTSGAGTFNQAGGQVTTYNLYLGNCGGCNGSNSSGTYNLTGGSLATTYELIGAFGHGVFVQNGVGTTNTVVSDLTIAYGPVPTPDTGAIKRSGSYELDVGTLNTNNTIVAVQGVGSFTQTGGFHNVAQTLTIGQQYTIPDGQVPVEFGGPSLGVYDLTGGVLTATHAVVVGDAGTGTLNQRGGVVTVGTWFDGQILANGQAGLATLGTLTIGAVGTGSYKLGATGQANNTAWPGYPDTPGTPTPSFNDAVNAPYLQVYGNVVIGRDGAGSSIDGNGATYAHGPASGSFVLAGDGSTLHVNNVVGTSHNGSMVIGFAGGGSVSQSDASTVYLDGGLALGVNAGASGNYTLNGGANGGGTLSVGADLNIGGSDDASGGLLSQTSATAGSGSFAQYAGAVAVVGHLSIATNPGALGSYALAGGSLTVGGTAYIGNNGGSGSFTQTGGSATLAGLSLGTTPALGPASTGTYTTTGSSLLTVNGDTLIATAPGTAGSRMTIGGGADNPSVNFNGYLTVGAGDQGSLTLKSGTVTVAASTYIGGSPTGVGSIVQTGGAFSTGYLDIGTVTGSGSPANSYAVSGSGTVTVRNNLVIGSGTPGGNPDGSGGSVTQSGSAQVSVLGSTYINNGNYQLAGGHYGNSGDLVVGDTKTGALFNQTGGSATVGGNLLLGNRSGIAGTYAASAGTLAVTGAIDVQAAAGGSGTFNIAGGGVTAASVANNGVLNYTAGTLALGGGAGTLSNNAGGQVNFAGTRSLSGSLSNAGHLTPGSTGATLAVSGSFAQTAIGSLDVLLGGAAGHSLVTVNGAATLNGSLDLICSGACNYALGDTIVILTAAGGVTGTFTGQPVLIGFAPTAFFTLDYSVPDEVLLHAAPVPEPQTFALFIAGLAAVGLMARRRRGVPPDDPTRRAS